MVTVSERDSIIQLLINFRGDIDKISMPSVDIKPELDSIAGKMAVAIASVEEEKSKLREAVEAQKVILINMQVEVVDKPKRRWGIWK